MWIGLKQLMKQIHITTGASDHKDSHQLIQHTNQLFTTYLTQSPDCIELIQLYDNIGSQKTITGVQYKVTSLLLDLIAYILISYKPQYTRPCNTICKKLIEPYNDASPSLLRVNIIKKCLYGDDQHIVQPALHLMIAYCKSSSISNTLQLIQSLSINQSYFIDLCNVPYKQKSMKRRREDYTQSLQNSTLLYNTRSLYIELIVTLLTVEQNTPHQPNLVKYMLQTPKIIQSIFKHLANDSSTVIKQLLCCIYDRILSNQHITTATKLYLFNEYLCQHLMTLYTNHSNTIDRFLYQVIDLLQLQCNQYVDTHINATQTNRYTILTSWSQYYYYKTILQRILQSLQPVASVQQHTLYMYILQHNPLLVPNAVITYKPSLQARASVRYMLNTVLLCNIYQQCTYNSQYIQHCINTISNDENSGSNDIWTDVDDIITQHMVPKQITKSLLTTGLHSTSPVVLYTTLYLINHIVQQYNKLYHMLYHQVIPYSTTDETQNTVLRRLLPDVQVIYKLRHHIDTLCSKHQSVQLNGTAVDEHVPVVDSHENGLPELNHIQLQQQLYALHLSVLSCYTTQSLIESNIDLLNLIELYSIQHINTLSSLHVIHLVHLIRTLPVTPKWFQYKHNKSIHHPTTGTTLQPNCIFGRVVCILLHCKRVHLTTDHHTPNTTNTNNVCHPSVMPSEHQQLLQPLLGPVHHVDIDSYAAAIHDTEDCVYHILLHSGLYQSVHTIELLYTVQCITDDNFVLVQRLITTLSFCFTSCLIYVHTVSIWTIRHNTLPMYWMTCWVSIFRSA